MWVVGVGVFVEASSQRVVGVVDAQSAVFKAYQAVEQVPAQAALLAVVPAANLVAAFVVVVVGAGVFAQQVVHQFVALGVLVQRALVLLVFLSSRLLAGSKAKVSTPSRLVALSSRPTGS